MKTTPEPSFFPAALFAASKSGAAVVKAQVLNWLEESEISPASPDRFLLEGERPWTPVKITDLVDTTFSKAEVEFNRALIRNQLQQQFGHVVVDVQGLVAVNRELHALRQLLEVVEAKIERLVSKSGQSVCVPIRSFATEPFELMLPIDVLISPEDDGYQATFLDANLHAYGETKEEALSNIRAAIVETFHRLHELGDAALGKSMLRQKQILSHYMRRADASILR